MSISKLIKGDTDNVLIQLFRYLFVAEQLL